MLTHLKFSTASSQLFSQMAFYMTWTWNRRHWWKIWHHQPFDQRRMIQRPHLYWLSTSFCLVIPVHQFPVQIKILVLMTQVTLRSEILSGHHSAPNATGTSRTGLRGIT